ncbi:MAG: hypothetical protein J6K53_04285 [Roseburia sp.]|nr:hypothetical protein [Roseburia sp.]
MTLYLQRRRKSIRFEAGSRRCGCLLLAVMLLFSVLLPCESAWDVPKSQTQETGWEMYLTEFGPQEASVAETSVVAAPLYRRADVQVTGREISGARGVQSIEYRMSCRYRNLQQLKLFAWCLLAACIALAVQQHSSGIARRKRQWELVPRSRMIVDYICRADGKKNRLTSSIK